MDATLGALSANRLLARTAWYWSALVRAGEPLLHVTEWDVALRADAPGVLKAHGLWAEHVCVAPMEQWTVSNECYATAIDDADDALGRATGQPTAIALDLEWYATAPPEPSRPGSARATPRTASCTASSGCPARRSRSPRSRPGAGTGGGRR